MANEIIDQKRRAFLGTSIDMYDRAQFVTPAVGKLADFFGRHLADARGSR